MEIDSDVRGNAGHGINFTAVNSNTTIEMHDGTVSGSSGGIVVVSSGAGIGGDITSSTQENTAVTGNVFDGIIAEAVDDGSVNVSALGAVTGSGGGDGIDAIASGNGTVDVTTGAKEIKGADDGISAFSDDSTAKVTTGAGKVTGTYGNGILSNKMLGKSEPHIGRGDATIHMAVFAAIHRVSLPRSPADRTASNPGNSKRSQASRLPVRW